MNSWNSPMRVVRLLPGLPTACGFPGICCVPGWCGITCPGSTLVLCTWTCSGVPEGSQVLVAASLTSLSFALLCGHGSPQMTPTPSPQCLSLVFLSTSGYSWHFSPQGYRYSWLHHANFLNGIPQTPLQGPEVIWTLPHSLISVPSPSTFVVP